jgi:putative mRNA 3-end processing factor
LGENIIVQGVEYGEKLRINNLHVSFHPAGHLPGSAQVRVESKGVVWVVSGDFKTEYDNLATPFEPVKCNVFVTESTFGMPVFQWPDQEFVYKEINEWWAKNRANGLTSVIFAYSLGKAQRILKNIDTSVGQVFVHGAVGNMNEAYREAGIFLPETKNVLDKNKSELAGSLIIAPPSAQDSPWMKRFFPYSTGYASGWMAIRGIRRRRAIDRGFVISDHADWNGLLSAIKATGARKIIATHGYTAPFVRYLREIGFDALEEKTEFTSDLSETEENPEF